MSGKSSATVSPPLVALSDTNHAGQVSVVALSFLMIAILAAGAKEIMACVRKVWTMQVDFPIMFSLSFAFIQTVLVQCAVNHGLGQHIEVLTTEEVKIYHKYNYASSLLENIVVAMAKLAIIALVARITPERKMKMYCFICVIAIALWTAFAMFTTAFQCKSPIWEFRGDRCAGKGTILYPIVILDILLDILIIAISQLLIWGIQVNHERRFKLASAFGSRVAIIIANITRMVYIRQYIATDDVTWGQVNYAICTQVAMNLNIITSCIPGLYRILSNMTSGLIGLEDHTQRIELSYLRSGSDRRKRGYLTGALVNATGRHQATPSSGISVCREFRQDVERVDDSKSERDEFVNAGGSVISRAESVRRGEDQERLIEISPY